VPATPAPPTLPLAEDRYKVQLTASGALRDKVEQARALMRHRNPSGDLAVIIEQAVDLLLAALEKEKLGKTSRPRRAKPSADPGYISQAARRAVAERDGVQCSFVSDDGARCPSTAFLEFDHRRPRALGGEGDPPNVRILCRAHNRLAAEKVFGREHIAERMDLRRSKCGRTAGDGPTREAPEAKVSERRPDPKEQVRSALRHMGIRTAEADRALAALDPHGWDLPIERLVRDAIGVLHP
jgi:hypothetical protein